VTRDIIRRDFDHSLEYAKRMNICYMAVIGAAGTAPGEMLLVTVADGSRRTVGKEDLLATAATVFHH
jgi:ATP phosphoribosyltransferase regulatory subunit